MDFLSPRQINDDPTLWLSVLHDMHADLLELQDGLFPGFKAKLQAAQVHCLRCESRPVFQVVDLNDRET